MRTAPDGAGPSPSCRGRLPASWSDRWRQPMATADDRGPYLPVAPALPTGSATVDFSLGPHAHRKDTHEAQDNWATATNPLVFRSKAGHSPISVIARDTRDCCYAGRTRLHCREFGGATGLASGVYLCMRATELASEAHVCMWRSARMLILRNAGALAAGFIAGSLVNIAIISAGMMVLPPPEGVDLTDMDKFAENVKRLAPAHFVAPWLGHALGTLVGAFTAAKVAASHPMAFALGVGSLFLVGGLVMVLKYGGPIWFNVVDLACAYLPMGYLGGLLGRSKALPHRTIA